MAVSVAVLGYAGADRAVRVPALPAPDRTAVVRERLSAPWPRLGGCGPLVAAGLAGAGHDVSCLTWLGTDALGGRLLAELEARGVRTDAVVRAGTRTAESYLVYADDGRALCFYDPGDAIRPGLSPVQRDALAAASTVCLTVAHASATRDALATVDPAATLVWSVKADEDAYPPDLVAALLARADVVALAAGERRFLAEQGGGATPRPDALVVETRGAREVSWQRGAQAGTVPVAPLAVSDTTGAGDALVAGVVGRLLENPDDAAGAVRGGVVAARALLAARTPREPMDAASLVPELQR